MPLVTLTVQQSRSLAWRTSVLDAVHAALVASGVPQADLFQRVLALAPEDLRFDPRYPDLARDRDDSFVIVEILWSVGRSLKVRRKLLGDLMADLAARGVDTEQVMVCFKETTWENWSFAGGRVAHA
ncbi:MAG: tautomerase family protein [Burkholderiales bacterium]|nr:tautomerase family protein [Burkholderiales bacterium]